MDTLVVGADDKHPLFFQRKFLLVPDSEIVVAGTGHAGFINGWFQYLQANLRGVTIEDLNSQAPNILRASVEAGDELCGLTATLYHFGYSDREGRYVGYAYRSKNDFDGNQLSYGLGLKPVVPITLVDDIRFPQFLIDIMLEQQRKENLLPTHEKVGIGGEIEFVVMSNHAINIETVHRFSSHESESAFIAQRKRS